MTIQKAISTVDALKPNTFTDERKVEWLSTLDGRIKSKILDNHEGEPVPFTGYNEMTNRDTELLVPAPYDEMYLRWLEAQIDYYNGEEDRYNNAIILFESIYRDFKQHYTRTYMPLSAGSFVF